MSDSNRSRVAVVGGGLAGCEAASFLAQQGHPVDLFEMKPKKFSSAHSRETFAELVCSNSFGTDDPESAPGLLKGEMRALGSVTLAAADASRVPAGRALGVDRDKFSSVVSEALAAQPLITTIREEAATIPEGYDLTIVATGPLTSDLLAGDLAKRLGTHTLYFYDSISPIVTAESVDPDLTYYGSRYDPESQDYLNCPLDRTTYERFVQAVLDAEKVPIRAFEAMRCFEACLPVEVLAERGLNTLAFGPMKPVGLPDPRTGRLAHAVVQLRRENDPTTLYNLVGFQTRMKWGDQQKVFRMIPGLEKAEFARMGSMHRNTYVESPKCLNPDLSLRADSKVLLAGQLTGVEGYTESACMGIWAGMVASARLAEQGPLPLPPPETAMGALLKAITTRPLHGIFSPMNINFGLFPPDESRSGGKAGRRQRIVARALRSGLEWRIKIAERLGVTWPEPEAPDPEPEWGYDRP